VRRLPIEPSLVVEEPITALVVRCTGRLLISSARSHVRAGTTSEVFPRAALARPGQTVIRDI
jgi:hypothetical protein